MDASSTQRWAAWYAGGDSGRPLVPESFVARVFLSRSPVALLRDYDFAGRRLLDLGCGEGRHTAFFAHLGFAVACCEVSDAQVARLETRFPDADVRRCTARALSFEDGRFDYVAAVNSIYYLEEAGIEDHLAEAARVLRPGGALVVSFVGERHFILRAGERHADGTVTLARDPLGFRQGTRLRPAWDRADLEAMLTAGGALQMHRTGELLDTCQGLTRHLHYAVAYRE